MSQFYHEESNESGNLLPPDNSFNMETDIKSLQDRENEEMKSDVVTR